MPTSPKGTIETSEVWKRFRVDQRPSYLQDQIARVGDRLRGRSRPSWRWVLRDVNIKAAPGESWGLVGANGAGKSTLLKILSRVMYPTAGSISVTGRVGALIEVRAGITPLLTGRENIYLTGSIMGINRREISKRFDEIVEFASLQQAIDRQVKYYSTGMQMRLGFGVAAFLQPDVLLVDEVLAVGDASFQQQCLERIRAVLAEGTTLIFVSHDLAAVEATCTNGIWMRDGSVASAGPIRDVLTAYRGAVEGEAASRAPIQGRLGVRDVTVDAPEGGPVATGGSLEVGLTLDSASHHRAWIYVGVSEGAATPIFLVNPGKEITLEPGSLRVHLDIASVPLPRGRYYLWIGIYENWTNGPELVGWQPLTQFDVYGPELDAAPRAIVRLSPLQIGSAWEFSRDDALTAPVQAPGE